MSRCSYIGIGGMLLPYNQARYHMFQQLQPQFPQPPTPSIPHSSIVDEHTLAKRVTAMILPSLAEMIESAVSSAFNRVALMPSTQNITPVDADPHSSNLGQPHISLNQSIRKSQPVENYVSDDDEQKQPALIDMFDDDGDEKAPLIAPIHMVCQSLPREINVLNEKQRRSSSIALSTPIFPFTSTCTTQILPHKSTHRSKQITHNVPNLETFDTDIMHQALHKIQILTRKPTATWTCKGQQTAMQAVLDLTNDVLVLMCTGSGKTMLAIVPSLLEKHSITVVVLPLKSLMTDYIHKLDKMTVPYEVFTSDSTKISGTKNLVLVSMDRARSVQWFQALAEVNQRVKVVRLVADEGQLVLTAEEYRDALKDPYELRQFPMQFVVLSGSLQPISEKALMDSFGLTNNAINIRTSTVRPELQYILETPKACNKDITCRVLQIIDHHMAQMSPQDRALVFVPYIQEGHILASLLGCNFYNGGEETTDTERQSAYDAWIQGINRIMICTAAFGAGNDYPHVRLVIHAGTPREMIGCIQEKSRAGRDGQPAKCYFLPKSPGAIPEIPPDTIDHQGKIAMHQWLFPTRPICLRYGLTLFCDGRGTNCYDDDSYQNCSVCQPSLLNDCPTTPLISQSIKRPAEDLIDEAYHINKQRKIHKEAQRLSYVDKMKCSLDFFQDICALCKVYGHDVSKHNIFVCPQLTTPKDHLSYVNWRNMIKYGKHHRKMCYRCHVPQCDDKLHGTFVKGSGQGCHYPDIIAPVAYAICQHHSLLSSACVHFKQKWSNSAELITWLNDKPIDGEKSNLTALFLWYYTSYCTTTN